MYEVPSKRFGRRRQWRRRRTQGCLSGSASRSTRGHLMTASRFPTIPGSVPALIDTVLAPSSSSRGMPRDGQRPRRRLHPTAEHGLAACGGPGKIDQLNRVVRPATRANVIDLSHLPSEVLSGTHRRLTRIQSFERKEIVRSLSRPGVTVKDAAAELGMSRQRSTASSPSTTQASPRSEPALERALPGVTRRGVRRRERLKAPQAAPPRLRRAIVDQSQGCPRTL